MTRSLLDDEATRDDAISAAAPDVLRVIDDGFWTWRVPSRSNCFDGVIEGATSQEDQDRIIRKALEARALWMPSNEALLLVEKLREGIGHDFLVEPWDPIMEMLPSEGPCPIIGRCLDVLVRKDAAAFEQAYLKLRAPREVRYPAASPSVSEYLQVERDGSYLCNVGTLWRVMILGPPLL
jgi:hypothetical protein